MNQFFKEPSPGSKTTRIASILMLNIMAFAVPAVLWLLLPGLMVPFLNHPIARLLMLVLVAWQIVGIAPLYNSTDFKSWCLYAITFGLPSLALWIIGPWCIMLLILTSPSDAQIQVLYSQPGALASCFDRVRALTLYWYLDIVLVFVAIVATIASYPGYWSKPLKLLAK